MRIGILGAGNMGRTHAAAYARMPDVEIVAIVGRREARVKEVTDSFGGTALTDPWKVLDDDTIDAIDVCYPTFMHREYAVAALQRGKHVFCETPIALSVEDADAMIAAARSSGKLLLVALLMRLVADYAYIHDVVASGDLGRPLVAYASRLSAGYRSPERPSHYGEPVVELMTFDFDYLNWLFGMPVAVSGTGVMGATGVAEYAFVSLEFDGVKGLVEGGAIMPRSFPFSTSIRVVCEEGALESHFRIGPEELENVLTRYPKTGSPEILDIGLDPYEAECRYFFDCVQGVADPALLSAEAAHDALRVALAAKESLERGGERVMLNRER